MRRLGDRLRSDDGSTLPLIIFYAMFALILVLVVAAATSLYLERKLLFTLADGAALVGAEAFELDALTFTPLGVRPVLEPVDVHEAVVDYLDGNPVAEFESLVLEEATTVDGRSATVTVSAVWHPPIVTAFLPDGLRIASTATARSVFG